MTYGFQIWHSNHSAMLPLQIIIEVYCSFASLIGHTNFQCMLKFFYLIDGCAAAVTCIHVALAKELDIKMTCQADYSADLDWLQT